MSSKIRIAGRSIGFTKSVRALGHGSANPSGQHSVILLDCSDSMAEPLDSSSGWERENSKLHIAWTAVKKLPVPPVCIVFGSSVEIVRDFRREPQTMGGTALQTALDLAYLHGNTILVVSDGLPTDYTPDYIISRVPAGVRIDCISIANTPQGEEFLHRLASKGRGTKVSPKDAETLCRSILMLASSHLYSLPTNSDRG